MCCFPSGRVVKVVFLKKVVLSTIITYAKRSFERSEIRIIVNERDVVWVE